MLYMANSLAQIKPKPYQKPRVPSLKRQLTNAMMITLSIRLELLLKALKSLFANLTILSMRLTSSRSERET